MNMSGKNLWRALFAFLLVLSGSGGAFGGAADHVHSDVSDAESASPGWAEKFKTQIEREEKMEGRAGNTEKVEAAMNKLMEEIAKGTGKRGGHTSQGGPFSDMSMMQQMDRSFLLGPSGVSESVKQGGP